MTKRRKPGDIVWKRENAGFVGQPAYIRIEPEMEGEDAPPCMICDDYDCSEWSNCTALPGETLEEARISSGQGERLGVACHVSECEMLDDRP